jgi:hypothetical protein
MDISMSRADSRFRNLLDAVAADSVGLSRVIANDPSVLGPCVGDDGPAPIPYLTVLGPCVGDDETVSDSRLKEDVCRIGTTVFGLPLYHFKYLGKPETYEGVMAQEVLKVMPGAVSVAEDGFYRVNYRALGTVMRRVS